MSASDTVLPVTTLPSFTTAPRFHRIVISLIVRIIALYRYNARFTVQIYNGSIYFGQSAYFDKQQVGFRAVKESRSVTYCLNRQIVIVHSGGYSQFRYRFEIYRQVARRKRVFKGLAVKFVNRYFVRSCVIYLSDMQYAFVIYCKIVISVDVLVNGRMRFVYSIGDG